MRRFTSRSPIFDVTNAGCVAIESVRKTSFFRTFLTPMLSAFVAFEIGELQQNLRIRAQLFCIYHFVVGTIPKYLITPKVLMGCFFCCQGTAAVCQGTAVYYYGSNHGQHYKRLLLL